MDKHKRWSSRALALGVILLTVGSLVGLVYASSGGEATAHGDAVHASSLTGPKLKDLLWRTLNFAVLVVILIKYLAKPIAGGLAARRDSIKSQFGELESKKGDAERTYREYEQKLSAIDQEVKGIVAAAIAQGEAEKNRIIEEATRAASDIKRQAEMAIQQEVAAAKARLRDDVAEQAAGMAEELIRKNLKAADHIKMIDNYLEQLAGQDYQQKVVRIQ